MSKEEPLKAALMLLVGVGVLMPACWLLRQIWKMARAAAIVVEKLLRLLFPYRH